MPTEKITDETIVQTADHPPRTESPEYEKTREWLMAQPGGCYVCGGPIDMSHTPEASGMQDHHGGGIFRSDSHDPGGMQGQVMIAYSLFGMEWSLGWSASPARVQAYVNQLNEVAQLLGGVTYDTPINTTEDVMAWLDSAQNASVKLCAPHHVGHEAQDTKDINGHQAVGIHNTPMPIWLGQVTCDWARWDMWGGTTGTVCVAPVPPEMSAEVGSALVLHVSPLHPDFALYTAHIRHMRDRKSLILDPEHEIARGAMHS